MDIERLPDKYGFSMTQSYLMERILNAANFDLRMKNSRPTPSVGPLLIRYEDGPDRKHDCKYRTFTRMIGYLQVTSSV